MFVRELERVDGPSRRELGEEFPVNDRLLLMDVPDEREDSMDLPLDGDDLKLLREREGETGDLPEDPSLRVSPENAVMETRQKIAIKPMMPVFGNFMIFNLLMVNLVLQAENIECNLRTRPTK